MKVFIVVFCCIFEWILSIYFIKNKDILNFGGKFYESEIF